MVDTKDSAALTAKLEEAVVAALTPKLLKDVEDKLQKAAASLLGEVEYFLRDDLAGNLSAFCQEMADKSVMAMLSGDEEHLRSYLNCAPNSYTGRERKHQVIHGVLHEGSMIELRKQIVNAYPEVLKSERILDLESQVASLVSQNNVLEVELRDERRRNHGQ